MLKIWVTFTLTVKIRSRTSIFLLLGNDNHERGMCHVHMCRLKLPSAWLFASESRWWTRSGQPPPLSLY